MAYKNILFDLGNVIISLAPERTHQGLKKLLSIEYDLFSSHPYQLFYDYETGAISEIEFFNEILSFSNDTQLQYREIQNVWNAMLLDIPLDRLEMMESLSETYKVFILSNTNKTHISWVESFLKTHYGQSNWSNWGVEKAFYSHETRSRKPEKAIFDFVEKKASILPAESIFIDDHLPNVEAARKYGWNAVHHAVKKEITHEIVRYLNKDV